MNAGKCNELDLVKNICKQVNIGIVYRQALAWAEVIIVNGVPTPGDPIKLSGYEFTGEIKDEAGGSVIVDLPWVFDSSTTGMYVDDVDSGIVFLQIAVADTTQTAKNYPYQILVKDPGGVVAIHLRGDIQFYTEGF